MKAQGVIYFLKAIITVCKLLTGCYDGYLLRACLKSLKCLMYNRAKWRSIVILRALDREVDEVLEAREQENQILIFLCKHYGLLLQKCLPLLKNYYSIIIAEKRCEIHLIT